MGHERGDTANKWGWEEIPVRIKKPTNPNMTNATVMGAMLNCARLNADTC